MSDKVISLANTCFIVKLRCTPRKLVGSYHRTYRACPPRKAVQNRSLSPFSPRRNWWRTWIKTKQERVKYAEKERKSVLEKHKKQETRTKIEESNPIAEFTEFGPCTHVPSWQKSDPCPTSLVHSLLASHMYFCTHEASLVPKDLT